MSDIHFLSLKFTLLMYSKQRMKQGIILLILGSQIPPLLLFFHRTYDFPQEAGRTRDGCF